MNKENKNQTIVNDEQLEEVLKSYADKKSLQAYQKLIIDYSECDRSDLSETELKQFAQLVQAEKMQLNAQKTIKNAKNKAKKIVKENNEKARKERNRKLIHYGMIVEKAIKDGRKTESDILSQLDKLLTSDSDRSFHGLAPLPKTNTKELANANDF